MGFSETIRGVEDYTGSGVIENMEGQAVRADATLTFNTSGVLSYNGFMRDRANATGTGILNIVVSGNGTQILSGGNITYSGTTTINPGATLVLENTTAFGNGSGGAANQIGARTINNNGTIVLRTAGTFNFNRDITGTGGMIRDGGAAR